MSGLKISVITAAYNCGQTIEKAITSVIDQDYQNWEHIIIDGGSVDGTVDHIKKYVEKYPDKIRWTSGPDRGIYDALNKGLKMASGDMVSILGGDDWYEPGAFAVIAKNYNGDERYKKILYGLVNILENGKSIKTEGYHHENLRNVTLNHQGCFVDKKIYEKYGGFDTQYAICADYDFFLRVCDYPDVEFVSIKLPLVNFSAAGASSNDGRRTLENLKIKKKYGVITKKQYFKKLAAQKTKALAKMIFGV
ncbi:MAG: glycosyltransferase [Spirochaetales bacterium]|jgi:glycosyltransferase|nr:glycosyltransferase [Spirochaetales bacterium]